MLERQNKSTSSFISRTHLYQITVDQDQDLLLPAYVVKHDGSKHVLQQIQMLLSMTLLSNKLTFLNLSQLMQ